VFEFAGVLRARWKSGGGPPHSKTLARWPMTTECAERLGVRQSSGALVGTFRGAVPAGAFPFLASGISAGPPGTGKRGPADGAARHPYHGATPEMATGTGALPGKVPIGGRVPAPANGSLGWTNGAMGG